MNLPSEFSVSVVVPLLNEADNILQLVSEIEEVAQSSPIIEIVLVDDGSTDNTARVIQDLKKNKTHIKLIRHSQSAGQSAALRSGIRAATSPVIITLDGDGQNNPADIPKLIEAWTKEPLTPMLLVAGQRLSRQDDSVKKITSFLGNSIRRILLQDGVRDTGCSLKLFRRLDYLSLPYFNHMHRFLPALFLREYGKIILVSVDHRPRAKGVSKYGFFDRLFAGISDLFGVLWLRLRKARKINITIE
jgi:dolichol-phosphate mannosyltransferase